MTILASVQENCVRGFVKNKGTDNPVHLPSLISAFLIHFLNLLQAKFQFSIMSLKLSKLV